MTRKKATFGSSRFDSTLRSTREIAEELGCSAGTVSNRMRKVYDRLIRELGLPDDTSYAVVEYMLWELKEDGRWK